MASHGAIKRCLCNKRTVVFFVFLLFYCFKKKLGFRYLYADKCMGRFYFLLFSFISLWIENRILMTKLGLKLLSIQFSGYMSLICWKKKGYFYLNIINQSSLFFFHVEIKIIQNSKRKMVYNHTIRKIFTMHNFQNMRKK